MRTQKSAIMNKFKFYFIVLITTLSLFSCSKNDTPAEITPARDYKLQFDADNTTIETYLDTHYLVMDLTDMDVVIKPIPVGGLQRRIKSYEDNATKGSTNFPQLWSRNVSLHGINYKVYYLILREGKKNIVTGLGGQSPSNSDAVLASYSGSYLQYTTAADVSSVTATPFEESKFPNQFFSLLGTIKGWGEIFPQFKTGSYEKHKVNDIFDGTIDYTDFGAGVMFIPSGLAYYDYGAGSIPSYAPLVFSFKLYAIQRLDSDGDGVLNYQEDLDGNGYMYDYRNLINYPNTPSTNPDDTDGDGIPNFIDVDDDGDGYITKLEITKPTGIAGPSKYYPYNLFVVQDDPLTTEENETITKSEPMGIPDCLGDGTTTSRVRKHLDKSCH